MKKTIVILALAAVGMTTANAGVRFGINFGIPVPAPMVVTPAPIVLPSPAPAPMVEDPPACPVPGYVWVDGSWAGATIIGPGHAATGRRWRTGTGMLIGTTGFALNATKAFIESMDIDKA